MSEMITLEIQAEASGEIAADRDAVWRAVADLDSRPGLKLHEPISGAWPEETAQVRVVMDKGEFEMLRTETIIRCVTGERLLVKVDAPQWGSTAYLDHRIDQAGDAWRLTIDVIAIATFADGAGPASRDDYAAMTKTALQAAVDEYRKRIEAGQ